MATNPLASLDATWRVTASDNPNSAIATRLLSDKAATQIPYCSSPKPFSMMGTTKNPSGVVANVPRKLMIELRKNWAGEPDDESCAFAPNAAPANSEYC